MRAMIETKNGRMRSMIHDGSQILNRSIAKLLFGLTAFLVLHTDMVAAQEAVTVQEILTDPALFHLRQITLRGTAVHCPPEHSGTANLEVVYRRGDEEIARNVQPLDPYEIPAGSTCYGGYLFNLEDDTATLPVAVPGLCGVPMVKDPDVEDGARVVVEATVQAPSHGGYALSFKGGKIAMDQEGVVQAIANRIMPLVE